MNEAEMIARRCAAESSIPLATHLEMIQERDAEIAVLRRQVDLLEVVCTS
jgi:hypothetical protein